MSEPIRAIYENGVFKPLEALYLPEHQQVRLTVEPAQSEPAAPITNGQIDSSVDPLVGIRALTGIPDLAENFDDYRFGKRHP